jgi:GH24 family phage-related lysozyme (muramidase)
VIEPLAAKAKGGMINPTQLNQRVSQVYRRAHTIGESGDIGDLARIGNELMPVLGGSDTAEKLLYMTGAGGTAVVNAPLTGAALAGNRLLQSGVNRNQALVNKLIERGVSAGDPNMIGSSVRNIITDQSGAMGSIPVAPAVAGGAAAANAPEQPTRIIINPAAEGTEGVPDVNLPKGRNLFAPDVTLPATIPDTVAPQSSNFTQQNEGLRLSTYIDTTGNPTIGRGFNLNSGIAKTAWKEAGIEAKFDDVLKGRQTISENDANRLERVSHQIAVRDAYDLYPRLTKMTPNQQIALADLSYNMGKPTLQGFQKMNKAINEGNMRHAVVQLMRSEYAKQVPERARRVAKLLLT